MGVFINFFFSNLLIICISWNCINFVDSVPAPHPHPQIELTSDNPFFLQKNIKPECKPTKEEMTMVKSKVETCKEKLGNVSVPILDDNFVKTGYNDQCFTRCVFFELQFLTEDGEPREEEMLKVLKTAPTLEKERTTITKDCLKSSKEMVTEEGGMKAVPCKYSAILAMCLMQGDRKLCEIQSK